MSDLVSVGIAALAIGLLAGYLLWELCHRCKHKWQLMKTEDGAVVWDEITYEGKSIGRRVFLHCTQCNELKKKDLI